MFSKIFILFYKKLTFLLFSSLIFTALCLNACTSRGGSSNIVDSVRLVVQEGSFFIGETKTISVEVEVSGNASKEVIWEVKDEEEIINIVNGGKKGDNIIVLHAKGVGKLTITATSTFDSNKKDSAELIITAPTIKDISILGINNIILGQATTLRTVIGADGDFDLSQAIDWSIEPNDGNLSILREEGNELRVRGDATGSITIKATSKFDDSKQAILPLNIMARAPLSGVATLTGLITTDKGNLLKGAEVATISDTSLHREKTNDKGAYSVQDIPVNGNILLSLVSPINFEGVRYVGTPLFILRASPQSNYKFNFTLRAEEPLLRTTSQLSKTSTLTTNLEDTIGIPDGSLWLGDLPANVVSGSARVFNPANESNFFPNAIVNGQDNLIVSPAGFVSLDVNGDLSSGAALHFLLFPENLHLIKNDDGFLNDREDRIDIPVYYFNSQTKTANVSWESLSSLGWLEDASGPIAESELKNIQQSNYPNDIFVATQINTSGWFAAGYETQSACLIGRLLYSAAPDPVDFGNILVEPFEGNFGSTIYTTTDALGNFRISSLASSNSETHKVKIIHLGEDGTRTVFDNDGLGYTVPNTPETEDDKSCGTLDDLLISDLTAEPEAEMRQYNIKVIDDKGKALISDSDNNPSTEVDLWDSRVDGGIAAELCAENTCSASGQTNSNGQVSLSIPVIPSQGDISVRISHNDSSNLKGGSEISQATFSGNVDASITSHQVEVKVERKAISVSPSSLFIGATDIKTASLEIKNTGNSPLSINEISAAEDWLEFSETQFESIEVDSLVNLEITFNLSNLESRVYKDSIEINSNAGQLSVPVTLAANVYYLSGVVSELNANPLEGAIVSAESGGRSLAGTNTNSNGFYELLLPTNLPKEVRVNISKAGYKTEFKKLNLTNPELRLDAELVKITDDLLFYEGFEDCESNAWGWVVNNSGYDGQIGTNDDGLWHCRDKKPIKNEALEKGFVSLLPTDNTQGFVPLPYKGNRAYWYGNSVPANLSLGAETGNYLGVQSTDDSLNSGGTSLPKAIKDEQGFVIDEGGNTGTLQSPFIDLTRVSSARLEGVIWYELESQDISQASFDQMNIFLVSFDSQLVTHKKITLNPPINPENSANNIPYTSGGDFQAPTWIPLSIDLNPLVGKDKAAVLFEFKTNDEMYNGFRGWLIDELYVYEGAPD